MSKLYLMRHGQTVFNVRHLIQGWCDSPLTELGIAQAEAARDLIEERGIRFDHACCSTAERACDTCEIVTRGAIPYTRLKGLREFHFGSLEACDNSTIVPSSGCFGDALVQYGGEAESDVAARMTATLAQFMLQPGCESVLAVSHGGATLAFLMSWNRMSPVKVDRILGNCAVCELDFDPEALTFSCVGISDLFPRRAR